MGWPWDVFKSDRGSIWEDHGRNAPRPAFSRSEVGQRLSSLCWSKRVKRTPCHRDRGLRFAKADHGRKRNRFSDFVLRSAVECGVAIEAPRWKGAIFTRAI